MNGSTIATQALDWLGVPYAHQQSTRWGCDCIGLVIGIAKELELVPPTFQLEPYSREPDPAKLLAGLEDYLTPIPLDQKQTGDILLFKIRRHPRHLAIYNPPDIIHALDALDGEGVVSTNLLDEQFWAPRLISAYRFPGL